MNEVLDVPKDAIMPPVSWRTEVISRGKMIVTGIHYWGWEVLSILFFIATVIAVIRIVFLGVFVFRSRQIQKGYTVRAFSPPITILVPAYNEEKVIERTVE